MDNLRIAVILGANRNGRTGTLVGNWFLEQVGGHSGLDVDVLDVADLDPGDGHGAPVADFGSRVAAADGFVVVTPEYNHGYPGPLKSAIDSARREWFGKPVGFVSYGGRSGGLRAVEQLRAVFSELHTTTLRDTVSFHDAHTVFGPDGVPAQDMSEARLAVRVLVEQLEWWALALREARERRPYPGIESLAR
ncbi:NADPH-dependent FMN reductase [Nocardiopsis aegyptia]|uniref:NAD(P)H-dependent FMN reductase n=1 Tax=Nocardiopsis aegyptia TaxID=220378 RepID=A0A7Z0ERY8_9ACTN|nr:NAD(P)H-dependent oxidoreductase [Nocardiopsis aegyptia]NYJ37190.1 NAD(P)H-dependent FMN reductase [Nocardiopsis aegyptia]